MQEIINVINKMFVGTDNYLWKELEGIFTEEIIIDFSSYNGSPKTKLKAKDLINSWKLTIPGFDSVHHQTGNFIVENLKDDIHDVICYGTTTRKIGDEIETVVGSYDFAIVSKNGEYKISAFAFNFKYRIGNDLTDKATAKVANK